MCSVRYGTGLLLLSLLLLGCEAERVLGPLPPASLPKEGPAPLPSVSSGALPQVSGDRWAEVVAWLQQVRQALGAPYVAFVSWRDEAGRWRYRYVVLRVPRRWVRESGGREQVYWFRREWEGVLWGQVLAWVPSHERVLWALRWWVGRRGSSSGSAVVQGNDCAVSGGASFMYVPSCGCYVFEEVEVVCSAAGGGGSWPPTQEDPRWWQQEGGLGDCADLWCEEPRSGGGGGGSGSGSGAPEEACTEDALTCEEQIGKLVRLARKLREAIDKGKDLLEGRTWSEILKGEKEALIGCGVDALETIQGNPVALVSVLNCVTDLFFGVNFFDMLKLLDTVDAGLYRKIIGYLHKSALFPRLAQAFGDFANTIDDVELLEKVAKLDFVKVDKNGRPIYQILRGDSQKIIENFAQKWNVKMFVDKELGLYQVMHNGIVLTRYSSSATSLPTIQVNVRGRIFKVRFGR